MTVEKAGARALIVGVCAEIAVMAAHPNHVGPPVLGPHSLATIVHSVALIAAPLMAFGGVGLTRFIGFDKWRAVAGLVFFALAIVAIMAAAVMSGLVQPGARDAGLSRDFLRYTYVINQGFANVYTALAAVAILAWASAWPTGRVLKIYGVVSSLAILAWQASGALTLDIHGMGAVALLQGAWMIAAAIILLRTEKSA
jgi:hypothetical protein